MTNPNHTDTSRSGDLVERLRGDWPEILVEKHWMMDSDAIDKQREEAADRIEALTAENERLREVLLRIADDMGEQFLAWVEDGCEGKDAIRLVLSVSQEARAALEEKQ